MENLAREVEEQKSISGLLLHTREVVDAETVARSTSGSPLHARMSAGRVRGRYMS